MGLRRQNVALLEEEADINQLTEYFSYEHFYVIYCKFWELDTDHDLLIDSQDLARHNDHGELAARVGQGGPRAPAPRVLGSGRCRWPWPPPPGLWPDA